MRYSDMIDRGIANTIGYPFSSLCLSKKKQLREKIKLGKSIEKLFKY